MSFRLSNKYLLLTYKTHCGRDFAENWSALGWEISWAHEIGQHEEDEETYNHTHVVIDFGKIFCTRRTTVFDFNGLHPNIKPLPGKKAYLDALAYIQKEGHEMFICDAHSLTLFESLEGLSKIEALQKCQRFSDVPGCLMMHSNMKRALPAAPDITLYPWQEEVNMILLLPPDRKIRWYWEPTGNVGKSTLARYMRLTHPEDVRVLANPGGMRDFSTIIVNLLEDGWTGKLLILDLPRNAESHSIYEPIEAMKNGVLNSVKYQGQEIILPCESHVVVFSNWIPDRSKASLDRWEVTNIRDLYEEVVESNPPPRS